MTEIIRTADNTLRTENLDLWNKKAVQRREILPGIYTHRGGFSANDGSHRNTRFFMKGAFAPEATYHDLNGLNPFMFREDVPVLMEKFVELREILPVNKLRVLNLIQQKFEDGLRSARYNFGPDAPSDPKNKKVKATVEKTWELIGSELETI